MYSETKHPGLQIRYKSNPTKFILQVVNILRTTRMQCVFSYYQFSTSNEPLRKSAWEASLDYTFSSIVISGAHICFPLKNERSLGESCLCHSFLVPRIPLSSRKFQIQTVHRAARGRLGRVANYQVAMEVNEISIVSAELESVEAKTPDPTRSIIVCYCRIYSAAKRNIVLLGFN